MCWSRNRVVSNRACNSRDSLKCIPFELQVRYGAFALFPSIRMPEMRGIKSGGAICAIIRVTKRSFFYWRVKHGLCRSEDATMSRNEAAIFKSQSHIRSDYSGSRLRIASSRTFCHFTSMNTPCRLSCLAGWMRQCAIASVTLIICASMFAADPSKTLVIKTAKQTGKSVRKKCYVMSSVSGVPQPCDRFGGIPTTASPILIIRSESTR